MQSTPSMTRDATLIERSFDAIPRRRSAAFTRRAYRQRSKAMRRIQILSMLSALALGFGAITAAAAEKPVALIIAQGGLGDQSYNDLANSGARKSTRLTSSP